MRIGSAAFSCLSLEVDVRGFSKSTFRRPIRHKLGHRPRPGRVTVVMWPAWCIA